MPDPPDTPHTPISLFISYSHVDSAFVDRLEADLRAQGFAPWVDREGLVAGLRWRRELQEAVEHCEVLLIVLSPEAVASTNVQIEYDYALDLGKMVIPVYYRQCSVPMELRAIQWVDFRHNYEQGLDILVRTLQRQHEIALPVVSSENQLNEPAQSAPEQAPDMLPAAPSSDSQPIGPLVGRQAEWIQLQQLWQQTSAGQSQIVVLSGEAGVGKTRLAEELFNWAAQQGLSTARAACYSLESNLAYAPVGLWLRADAIRKNLSTLAGLFLTEVARLVPQILVERPNLPAPGPLAESWQRQRLFEALARAMLAAPQPLLLLLDDLQWCDRETLEWLHYLLHFDERARLLIVATLRAEELSSEHPLHGFMGTLKREGRMTEMALGPLTQAETASLASQIAGKDLDPELLAQLYQDTEGNALFIVESVRVGSEKAGDAALELQGQAGEKTGVQEGRLPPTIQAVITARLQQLSPQAQEVVSMAAVIGRAFSFDLLVQVSKISEEALLEALDELWQRRIVREQGIEGYDFSHGKIREVAYAEVRLPRRRLLHRRVAEALEALHAGRLDAVSGDIAAHYEQAGNVERAVTYYQRAAEVAQQLYANADALTLYRRALSLLEGSTAGEATPEKIAQLYERLGDVLSLTAQYSEARAAYERALSHVPKLDRIWQARLQRQIGSVEGWIDESSQYYEQELQYYDMAEALLGPEPSLPASQWWEEWIQIQLFRMRIYYNWAKLPELEALVEKVRPLVEQHGAPKLRAEFLFRMALAGYLREHYVPSEETLQYQLGALKAIQESGDLNAIAEQRFALGLCYLLRNELGNAEDQLQTALDSAQRVGALVLQSRCLTYLTITYRKRGEIEKVREYAQQAINIATRLTHTGYIAMARGNMAWVLWREGNMPEAQKQGQASLEEFEGSGEPFEWIALWPMIGLAVIQQKFPDAVKYVRRLLAPDQQRLPDALTVDLEQAIQAWDSNQAERVHAVLQEAMALAQQMGYL